MSEMLLHGAEVDCKQTCAQMLIYYMIHVLGNSVSSLCIAGERDQNQRSTYRCNTVKTITNLCLCFRRGRVIDFPLLNDVLDFDLELRLRDVKEPSEGTGLQCRVVLTFEAYSSSSGFSLSNDQP